MKVCLAQTRPFKGDVHGNLTQHLSLVAQAAEQGADFVVFPELSLTGYEPALAKALAVEPHDASLNPLQDISDARGIAIGAGMPTRHEDGLRISLLLFQPRQPRRVYSKKYLHSDETPFFVPGKTAPHLEIGGTNLALAICYEISVPEHLASVLEHPPAIYVASVAKTPPGAAKAAERLSAMARDHSMPVLMANCVGPAEGGTCGGRSAAWNSHGELVGQLGELDAGLLVFDSQSQQLI